jgi:membrane protein YqaA with SNARE-associated domain
MNEQTIEPATIVPSWLNRVTESWQSLLLAFLWGLAEATAFFIVPDVLLTLIAAGRFKRVVVVACAALAGALIGGIIMYFFGHISGDGAHAFLISQPGISFALVESVQEKIANHGLIAVLAGPLSGIPYKIFAVECGVRQESLFLFLMISIAARYVRFVLCVIIARIAFRLLTPLTAKKTVREVFAWALFWLIFYAIYFRHFGW